MKDKYTIKIYWSKEDQAFLAICDEFPGLSAFGETREEALHEAEIALKLMIETYKSEGMSLPKPQSALLAA